MVCVCGFFLLLLLLLLDGPLTLDQLSFNLPPLPPTEVTSTPTIFPTMTSTSGTSAPLLSSKTIGGIGGNINNNTTTTAAGTILGNNTSNRLVVRDITQMLVALGVVQQEDTYVALSVPSAIPRRATTTKVAAAAPNATIAAATIPGYSQARGGKAVVELTEASSRPPPRYCINEGRSRETAAIFPSSTGTSSSTSTTTVFNNNNNVITPTNLLVEIRKAEAEIIATQQRIQLLAEALTTTSMPSTMTTTSTSATTSPPTLVDVSTTTATTATTTTTIATSRGRGGNNKNNNNKENNKKKSNSTRIGSTTAAAGETLKQIVLRYPDLAYDPLYVTALRNLQVDSLLFDHNSSNSNNNNINNSGANNPSGNHAGSTTRSSSRGAGGTGGRSKGSRRSNKSQSPGLTPPTTTTSTTTGKRKRKRKGNQSPTISTTTPNKKMARSQTASSTLGTVTTTMKINTKLLVVSHDKGMPSVTGLLNVSTTEKGTSGIVTSSNAVMTPGIHGEGSGSSSTAAVASVRSIPQIMPSSVTSPPEARATLKSSTSNSATISVPSTSTPGLTMTQIRPSVSSTGESIASRAATTSPSIPIPSQREKNVLPQSARTIVTERSNVTEVAKSSQPTTTTIEAHNSSAVEPTIRGLSQASQAVTTLPVSIVGPDPAVKSTTTKGTVSSAPQKMKTNSEGDK
jgi:hypothetical protein